MYVWKDNISRHFLFFFNFGFWNNEEWEGVLVKGQKIAQYDKELRDFTP